MAFFKKFSFESHQKKKLTWRMVNNLFILTKALSLIFFSIGSLRKVLSFPNLAYLLAGFVLLVGIVLLFMFLRRRRRIDTPYSDTNDLQSSYENEIYSLGIAHSNDHPLSASNKLYMMQNEFQNDISDVTEC